MTHVSNGPMKRRKEACSVTALLLSNGETESLPTDLPACRRREPIRSPRSDDGAKRDWAGRQDSTRPRSVKTMQEMRLALRFVTKRV